MAAVLVICDGSLPALVAAAAERDRGIEVFAWIPLPNSGLSSPGCTAPGAPELVRAQGALLGYARVLEQGAADARSESGVMTISGTLIEAVRIAAGLGCARVVWPITVGDDLSAMAWADERADLINRLGMLDEEAGLGSPPQIVLPLVDLSDAQVEDLATDLAVPRHLCGTPPVPQEAAA